MSEPLLEARICRIVQEALANVKRHARSERSATRLMQGNGRLHKGQIETEIEDWDIGFDPAHVTKDRFGLQGIRERVRLLRGRAVISSAPGKGPRVFGDLPVAPALVEVASANKMEYGMSNKIKLLVADDHEVVRTGLRSLLADTEVTIVAEVSTGAEAVKYALENDPDVVMLDVRMPDMDGLNALGRIKLEKEEMPILILSTFDNPTYIARAVALGASGYLLKGCTREKLLDGIRKAADGESAWTRDELRRVTGALATPRLTADVEVPLTQRESEVLRQLAYGLTNKEIAGALHISYETVKEHVQHILRKIGVSDRTQAAVWAVRKELV
jgi:DNA-binding NarL/FixJ family response regulator